MSEDECPILEEPSVLLVPLNYAFQEFACRRLGETFYSDIIKAHVALY